MRYYGLIILSFLSTGLAAYFGSLTVLAVLSSCLTIFCLLLVRDFTRLDKIVSRHMSANDTNNFRLRYSGKMQTELGMNLVSHLEALFYRLRSLSWQIHNEFVPSRELNSVHGQNSKTNPDIHSTELVSTKTRDELEGELLSKFLTECSQRLRSEGAAVIVPANSSLNVDILDLRIITSGVKGPRFESCLKHFLKSYFLDGDSTILGLRDGFQSNSLIGDFAVFGYRYTLSLPFRYDNSFGLIWLGFPPTTPPGTEGLELLRKLIIPMEGDLHALIKLSLLSDKVQEAKSRDKAKDEFLAHMSHDIRTPLNNVKSIINLIKLEGFRSDTPQMLESAVSNCDQMGEFVEDILDYNRHQAGQLKAKIERISVSDNLKSLVESFSFVAKAKGLKLVLENSSPQAFINADFRHFKRIIANIISNAIKYTKEGEVVVGFRVIDEGLLSIYVRDTGVGMSDEERNSLFIPFTRFNNPGISGVGLGLALSKILADLNRAKISVKSKPGEGSEFEVQFPIASCGTVVELTAKFLGTGGAVLNPHPINFHKILVVDDDCDAGTSLSRALKFYGFEAFSVSSVRDAISVINFEKPHAVITDSSMPDGGGRSIVRFLFEYGSEIPVIVVSGMDNPDMVEEYKRMGAAKVFTKPCDLTSLVTELKSLLKIDASIDEDYIEKALAGIR